MFSIFGKLLKWALLLTFGSLAVVLIFLVVFAFGAEIVGETFIYLFATAFAVVCIAAPLLYIFRR